MAKRKGKKNRQVKVKNAPAQKAQAQKAQAVATVTPLKPSPRLAKIVGTANLRLQEANEMVWRYVRRNGLQDGDDKRLVNPDDTLKEIVGQNPVTMFEMTKRVRKHLA